MRLWWTAAAALVVTLAVGCLFESSESAEETQANYVEAKDFRKQGEKIIMRRKIVRRKLNFATKNLNNSTSNISMSSSVSSQHDEESTALPEVTTSEASVAAQTLAKRLRPLFLNKSMRPLFKSRSMVNPTLVSPQEKESSLSSFKVRIRPRLGFAMKTTDTSTGTERASTVRPKVFSKKFSQLSKKIIKTETEAPAAEIQEEDQSVESNQEKINKYQANLKASSVTSNINKSKSNDSMIIIPVPHSQRKPYHPMIMQVTKSPGTESPTSLPETRVVTYKLNKMFVPMGIYGKVLPKSVTSDNFQSGISDDTLVSTPLPFLLSDQQGQQGSKEQKEGKGPEIRHKGTQSDSKEILKNGVDSVSSVTPTILLPSKELEEQSEGEDQQKKWEHLLSEIKAKNKKTRKQKEHSRIADTIDITYNYRPNADRISLTTEKMDASRISLTTERPMMDYSAFTITEPSGNRRTQQWGQSQTYSNNYPNRGSMNNMMMMAPPAPTATPQRKTSYGTHTFVDSLTDAASKIPSLFHKGITSLSSITTALSSENPFHDETFSGSDIQPIAHSTVLAAVPGGFIPMQTSSTMSPAEIEYETLEYFRNRPHLLGRAARKKFQEPSSFSSGFKPVTAPPHFAKEYYASTTTPVPRLANSKSNSKSRGFFSSTTSWPVVSTTSRPLSLTSATRILTSNLDHGASSNSWSIIGKDSQSRNEKERQPKMVATENSDSSWRTIFRPNEFGNQPASSWRTLFGREQETEEPSVMSSTFNTDNPNLEGGRRRSIILNHQWNDIRQKYSNKEIDEAKERIFQIISGPDPPSYEEMSYMKPPARVGNAFIDLLKMLRSGFNFQAGKSLKSTLDHLKTSATSNHYSDSGWRPLSKAGGQPLITFSAGITFGTKGGIGASPTPNYSSGSHYSSSSRPFVPYKFNGHKQQLSDFAHSYVSSIKDHLKPSPTSEYHKDIYYGNYKGSSDVYSDITPFPMTYSYVDDDTVLTSDQEAYNLADASTTSIKHAGTNSNSWKGSTKHVDLTTASLQSESPSSNHPSYSSYKNYHTNSDSKASEASGSYYPENYDESSGYELVPSDVYFSQKNPNMADIAAVIKPPDISDDMVKSQLPSQMSGVPTLNFPTRQLLQHPPQRFSSLSQLQQYLSAAEPKQELSASSYLPQKYQESYTPVKAIQQQTYHQPIQVSPQTYRPVQVNPQTYQPVQVNPQTYQPVQVSPQTFQRLQFQQVQNFMHPKQTQQPLFQYQQLSSPQSQFLPNVQHSHQATLKTSGDAGVGFSDFELPSNIDPDIASLIKSELDKDDIPEEFRKDFEEARKQEEGKQQAGPSSVKASVVGSEQSLKSSSSDRIISQASRRSDIIQPQHFLTHFSQPTSPVHIQPPPFFGRINLQSVPPPSPNSRLEPQIITKFHAPIPISPTLMSQTLRGRYNSPVPRYVVELARKLQKDRDVQGIVRVSTKRVRGPPIEYLYPVRG